MTILKTLVNLGFVALLATPTASYGTPTSYALTCRGGGLISFQYISDDRSLEMTFTRGQFAASLGVADGTCAWADRGVAANEPNKICDYPVDITFQWTVNGMQITYLEPYQDGATGDVDARYVKDLSTNLNTHVFQAYNGGHDCLVVTGR